MSININVVDATNHNQHLGSFDLSELGDVPRAGDQLIFKDDNGVTFTKNVQTVLWDSTTSNIQLAVIPPP
jgi:hypothetical protein